MNWVCENIKFHSNENIQWHFMEFEFNWIVFQLKKNKMKIDGETI
jgi:hypothetical protein